MKLCPGQDNIIKQNNSVYGSCTLHFLSIIYHLMKFQKVPLVVLELFLGQENLIKRNKSKSNKGRVKVLAHCTFS